MPTCIPIFGAYVCPVPGLCLFNIDILVELGKWKKCKYFVYVNTI